MTGNCINVVVCWFEIFLFLFSVFYFTLSRLFDLFNNSYLIPLFSVNFLALVKSIIRTVQRISGNVCNFYTASRGQRSLNYLHFRVLCFNF